MPLAYSNWHIQGYEDTQKAATRAETDARSRVDLLIFAFEDILYASIYIFQMQTCHAVARP